MVVSAINSVNSNHSRTCLVPVTEGALVGAGVGMALKYGYPLNKEEKSTKEYLSVMGDINKKKSAYSAWTQSMIEEINNKKVKSPAEDVFVKMYDGMKYDTPVYGEGRVMNAVRSLKDKPDALVELKHLFKNARLQADEIAKKHVEIYNLATKHIRPTGFFLIAGAITGAVVAMVHEVLRTEVK